MKVQLNLLFLLGIYVSANAADPEKEITANIQSVLVYTAAAELHYEANVKLRAGENTIVFGELSPYIIENTINVSVSNPDVNIITVSDRINFVRMVDRKEVQVKHLRDSIQNIQDRVGWMDVKLEALQAEKNILFKNESLGGVSNGVSVAEIERASEFFQKRYFELSTEIYALKKSKGAMEERRVRYTRQVSQLSTVEDRRSSEIRVTVNSPSAQTVTFKYKYLTAKGGWSPIYDMKYNGPDKPLDFIFRANVFNACGYAWDNVSIRLSTANPTIGFDMPGLEASKDKSTSYQPAEEVEFQSVEIFNAIVEYDIEHVYSIPSNAKPYVVDVESHSMTASTSYLLIPKMDPFGFLMAKIPNFNSYNLIPGTTNVYNRGTYMGRTFLNTYAENDTLSVFLGKDKSIQAVRKKENTLRNNKLIGNYFTDESEVDITIKNNTAMAYNITVLDQVPVINGLGKAKLNISGDDGMLHDPAEGSLTWNLPLPASETLDLHFKYDIRAPKEVYNTYRSHMKFREMQCPKF